MNPSTSFRPNPDPWSDVRPRLLGWTHTGARVVLLDDGDILIEEPAKDVFGVPCWVRDWDIGGWSDSLNLEADAWIGERYDSARLDGLFVECDGEVVTVYAVDYPTGSELTVGRYGADGVYRRADKTMILLPLPNAWLRVDPMSSDASSIRCRVVFRWMGGDPSVNVTEVSRG